MINTWFISDTHFGHRNILEYEKEARPFDTIQQMHEAIIERWNSVVAKKDIVYHLGDFCFGRQWIDIARWLNGTKYLVMGNHDTYEAELYLKYFEKLHGCIFWRKCVLSHMPLHPRGLYEGTILNVHGHLHSKQVMLQGTHSIGNKNVVYPAYLSPDLSYFNVSCEQNNLTPIHSDIIMDRVRELDAN